MSMMFRGERIAFTRVWVLAVALMALAGLFGCGQSKGGPASQTLEVAVVTLQAEPVALTTELAGRTVAYRVAEVRPQVSGIVLKRSSPREATCERVRSSTRSTPLPSRRPSTMPGRH